MGVIEMINIELFSQERAIKMLVREERIKGTVEGLLEMGVPPSKVLQRIMSKYNLLEEDAKGYLEEYKSESNLDSAEDGVRQ